MTPREEANVIIMIAVAVVGACSFGYWMESGAAGGFCFAAELLCMEAVSEIENAIRKTK